MTATTRQPPPATGVTQPATATTSVDWDRELRGAEMLRRSGLAPSALKTPEAILFVILAGRDLGLSPVQSLRSIHIIQGRLELSADVQLGLFRRAGGRAEWVTLTESEAVLRLVHPDGDEHTESFSAEDARRAKLGGENWAKYPKAMLRSRAITAGLKSLGFDPTSGVYAPGEIDTTAAVVVTEDGEVVPAPSSVVPVEPGEALLLRIVGWPCWTDEERQGIRDRVANAETDEDKAAALEEAVEEARRRKAEGLPPAEGRVG